MGVGRLILNALWWSSLKQSGPSNLPQRITTVRSRSPLLVQPSSRVTTSLWCASNVTPFSSLLIPSRRRLCPHLAVHPISSCRQIVRDFMRLPAGRHSRARSRGWLHHDEHPREGVIEPRLGLVVETPARTRWSTGMTKLGRRWRSALAAAGGRGMS
jgi:hypothetical protein